MIDITGKNTSYRTAVARAILRAGSGDTIAAIKEKRVPKGDVFEFSRAAGLLAIKKTAEVIPDCHPLPVEFASIRHEIDGLNINVDVEVHTIYKTGVEVEAMHGAAITALTMYDMLKPLDKDLEITSVKLLKKTGGKSGMKYEIPEEFSAAVIVCSDSVSKGEKSDRSGAVLVDKLTKLGVSDISFEVIPDDAEQIRKTLAMLCDRKINLIIFTGGTGVAPRDITPDTLGPMLDKEIPGIMEAARNYGQQRMQQSMLSRSIAGLIGQTLVLTFPGSEKGATETFNAVFPGVMHVFAMLKNEKHE